MAPELTDTDPEAARVHQALLRGASPARRLRLALSISETVIALARSQRGEGEPSMDARRDAGLRFVELHYGAHLAAGVRERLRVGRP